MIVPRSDVCTYWKDAAQLSNPTPSKTNSVDALISVAMKFAAARNWQRFHTPRNLACAISVEASELLELFQWQVGSEDEEPLSSETRERLEDEVADIALYLFTLCGVMNIPLAEVVTRKIRVNESRYPPVPSDGTWAGRAR